MLAYLVIREGTKWTDVFRLTPGRTVTIGRGSTNEIVIKDERCSRNHAEVRAGPTAYIIVDLGSTNGTMVNGIKITGEQRLRDGDIISFGSTHVRFEAS